MTEIARLALASARPRDFDLWRALFGLDARLGRIVAHAREPMLAQLRLAWWRDELAKPAAARAKGDPALDDATRCWAGSEAALIDLVDGWEALVDGSAPDREALQAFARGRAGACAEIARRIGCVRADTASARAGEIWALAERAANTRDENERALAIDLARVSSKPANLPREMRPLAVIAGLARRSVERGGAPLLGDRLSPLVAFRLGILGR